MTEERRSKYSPVDFLFTFGGLCFFSVDIVLDACMVAALVREGAFVRLGLLLLFLVGSSVLAQLYSWLWYRYDQYRAETQVERCLVPGAYKLLHVLQLGVYVRYASVLEVAVCSFATRKLHSEDVAVYLSHDLSMLRLVETFSESAPQLVLMLSILLQSGQWDTITLAKAAGSASAIACSVTLYHRSLRSFLPDKERQPPLSSLVYFLWNLLLIMPRISAIALFAAVLPCYVFTHFLCSWIILAFFAWRFKTTFMDSAAGEWLFRATVGLIWYFSWFSVVDGQTRYKALAYHVCMVLDLLLLCGLSYWQTPPAHLELSPQTAMLISCVLISVYFLGLVVRVIYYKCFHPEMAKQERKESDGEAGSPSVTFRSVWEDVPDSGRTTPQGWDRESGDVYFSRPREPEPEPEPAPKRLNKRMRKLAENFYS